MEWPSLDTTEKLIAIAASVAAIVPILLGVMKRKQARPSVDRPTHIPDDGPSIAGVNIQSGNKSKIEVSGSIVNHHVNTIDRRMPESLAKPDFVLRQTGCSLNGSAPAEYTFQMTNFGGDCFNVVVRTDDHNAEPLRFPQLKRSQSSTIKLKFTNVPGHIHIVIKGYDANGEHFTQNKFANRETQGFAFMH
jgi:hypothetical protein